jgi:hypothetical protein
MVAQVSGIWLLTWTGLGSGLDVVESEEEGKMQITQLFS